MKKDQSKKDQSKKDQSGTDSRESEYQAEPDEALSYMINAMSPGSRAIAEFKAANARSAGEPAPEPAPTGGEVPQSKGEPPKKGR